MKNIENEKKNMSSEFYKQNFNNIEIHHWINLISSSAH